MIPLTDKQNKYHENQKRCYICKNRFTKDNKRVKDHCHFTGRYGGATRNKCNMNFKITKDFPVVFHKGSIYDNHFIIKELVKNILLFL